jgi:hypothetical protein
MAASDKGVRTVGISGLESAQQHVVGFTCESCGSTMPVDSTTYESILVDGCVVCDAAADATAFSPRNSA